MDATPVAISAGPSQAGDTLVDKAFNRAEAALELFRIAATLQELEEGVVVPADRPRIQSARFQLIQFYRARRDLLAKELGL
jgi:hypothetical protein